MQGHLVRVVVDGHEVDDDFDLDDVASFQVETASGRTYRVQRTSSERRRPWTWDVEGPVVMTADGPQPCGLAGRVQRTGARWSVFAHEFSVPGRLLQGGSQYTLWNAVQSLTV
jgi:hypothetical protein